MTLFPLRICCLACLVFLPSCRRGPAAAPAQRQPIHVLVSVYPLADVVRQIGGQWVAVDWVAEGALDVRDVRRSEHLSRQFDSVGLVITSGFKDPWAGEDWNDQTRSDRILRPEQTPAGIEDAAPVPGEAGTPDLLVALWLDPEVVGQLCPQIADMLGRRDLDHAPEFRADAYAKQIGQFLDQQRRQFAALKGKRFLVIRPGWGALARRMGLQEIHPIDGRALGFTDDQARAIRKTASAEKVDLLVVDGPITDPVRDLIVQQTKLRLLVLDFQGSSARDGHQTYLGLLRYDLAELQKALSSP